MKSRPALRAPRFQTVLRLVFLLPLLAPTSAAATTGAASGIRTSGELLNGSSKNSYTNSTLAFEVGLTTADGNILTADQSPVSGLSPDRIDNNRVVGANASGTTSGDERYSIQPAVGPDAETLPATDLTSNGATLNGVVDAGHGEAWVEFVYGPTTSYGTTVTADQSPVPDGTNTLVSHAVTGLTPGMTYHYRVRAWNGIGTSTGEDETFMLALIPEMDIFFNDIAIADGDTTPSTTDGTDFGFVGLSTSTSRTFTIENNGTDDLTLSGALVEITGTHAADFSVTAPPVTPIPASGNTTFTIEFTPSAEGLRQATINIANNDSDENPYTFEIQGTSLTAPTVVFGVNSFPSQNATLAAGINQITLEFNIDVKGDAGPQAANHTGNYLLFSDGGDGFQTVDCASGVDPADVSIPISQVFYDDHDEAGPFLVIILINKNALLSAGSYRLLICGTTSIENHAGTELNDGADSSLNFTILGEPHPSPGPSSLPETGFAPGMAHSLPPQPASAVYTDIPMTLAIPDLDLSMPIVGVPEIPSGWDVTWLGDSAGYLAGTAFPTWTGNTVLTGHVWDTNNNPGPFIDLKTLQYGDPIQIHAWGKVYTYEVRESRIISPYDLEAALAHEENDWVTLLTCEDYDMLWETYSFRRMLRAVLVDMK